MKVTSTFRCFNFIAHEIGFQIFFDTLLKCLFISLADPFEIVSTTNPAAITHNSQVSQSSAITTHDLSVVRLGISSRIALRIGSTDKSESKFSDGLTTTSLLALNFAK